MSKARRKALEKFPILFGERMGYDKTNLQQERRNAFEKGYHQAEKDVIEKVCVLLEDKISENCYGNNLDFIVGTIYNIDFLDIEGLIDDIKKVMKDE